MQKKLYTALKQCYTLKCPKYTQFLGHSLLKEAVVGIISDTVKFIKKNYTFFQKEAHSNVNERYLNVNEVCHHCTPLLTRVVVTGYF